MTDSFLDAKARRALGRALSNAASDMSTAPQIPADRPPFLPPRIGITGPPGVGKSTLIDRVAARRLDKIGSLAVLAIDPTSPLSRGSLLGDRIRMDTLANNPKAFIRSVPSRDTADGLCDNAEILLRILEGQGFDEIFLETVGTGQAQVAIAAVVDTVVLVLSPDAGDAVQTMKSGLLELADIYVVNKADLPNSRTMVSDVLGCIDLRHVKKDTWSPVVVAASSRAEDGLTDLDEAITAHIKWVRESRDALEVRRRRSRQHVQNVLERRLAHTLDQLDPKLWDRPIGDAYHVVYRRLADLLELSADPTNLLQDAENAGDPIS